MNIKNKEIPALTVLNGRGSDEFMLWSTLAMAYLEGKGLPEFVIGEKAVREPTNNSHIEE